MTFTRKSLPWAPLGALLLLLVVELAVRCAGPVSYIAYERGPSARHAVRRHVMAYGSTEILVVGSSRSEMGIDCPLLSQGLAAQWDREVEVSNYALGGAQAAESVPMVRHILRQDLKPKVIIYGVGQEQIGPNELVYNPFTEELHRSTTPVNERAAMFWNMSDFREARETFGPQVDEYLPIVVRNGIERQYHTLRVRGRIMNALRNEMRGRAGSPILGESLDLGDRETSMAKDGYDAEEIRRHVEDLHLVEGTYPFHPQRLALFEQLVADCQQANVRLVFVELPNSEVFQEPFPADTRARFQQVFHDLAVVKGVDFFTLEGLGLTNAFGYEDFYDAVHLNIHGAKVYTEAIATKLGQQIESAD
ncbi:MAG: hypothetical protein GY879_04070 [Planctomycetes bacterium]|nr:hypothetical protein [Planctomycetota bacterium]MCP4860341.1 hypothetical protein [Planctomycetota bacterium]